MKMKNGKSLLFFGVLITACYAAGYFNRKDFYKLNKKNYVSFQQWVNRLVEFDIYDDKYVTDTFLNLIEDGFSPEVAFSFIEQNASIEMDNFNYD